LKEKVDSLERKVESFSLVKFYIRKLAVTFEGVVAGFYLPINLANFTIRRHP
jgi:hypothetical protein